MNKYNSERKLESRLTGRSIGPKNSVLIETAISTDAELRYATRRNQTWPGYHESCPLGKAGYWAGTHGRHIYLGRDKEAAIREFYSRFEV